MEGPGKDRSGNEGDGYFSAGDMGYRDEEGYLFLVDRKANMIISGGENIFPSEVENCVGGNPKVKDVAVIGIPHEKWGETGHGGHCPPRGTDGHGGRNLRILQGQDSRLQGPQEVVFIKDEEMPRTGNGKILHRVLREKYGMWKDHQ